ncbi:hypothetical protein [Paenibacillus chungangensis]|uniref:Uncharacterized protein n=1 Tax=Paenibacillus chungangensis TaxID=696535 RepID=A0ABW3HQK4_9BACL
MLGTAARKMIDKPTIHEQKKAQNILKKYIELKHVVEDYRLYEEELKRTIYESETTKRLDQDELYANKTANAVQLAQNQKRAAEECGIIMKALERAVHMIPDEEARQAISLRYLKGYTYTETLLYMNRGEKSSTMDRRIKEGLLSVARTLKAWGMLDWPIGD